jgi:hypothetical protein
MDRVLAVAELLAGFERGDLFVDGIEAAERRGGDEDKEKSHPSRLAGRQAREPLAPSIGPLDSDGGLALHVAEC